MATDDTRVKETNKNHGKTDYMEIVRSLLIAFVIAMTFRSCAYEPFHIPSGSMKPTLEIGDYIFVSKYAYGYSNYSFPLSPDLFEGRIWYTPPKRGDVVVFRLPSDESINYIKRLIGLPGDKVQVKDGQVFINGNAVMHERIGEYVTRKGTPYESVAVKYKETLDNEVQFVTLDHRVTSEDNTKVFHVPEGHYFFMGDNRDDSRDSRFSQVGMIPERYLIGRAEVIFFSQNFPWWHLSKWFTAVNLDRSLQE